MRADERGVSTVIGAILIFGFVVIAFTGYQATVVPNQNSEVEFEHFEGVQDDMIRLGSDVVSVANSDRTASPNVDLGVRYPPRLFAINPGPSAGRLEKRAQGDIEIDGSAVSDLCGGGSSTFGIGYVPNYNRLTGSDMVYENGQVYAVGDSTEAVLDSRTVVDTSANTIDIYRLDGELPTKAGTAPTSIDFKGAKAYGQTTGVQSVTFPSELSADKWRAEAIDMEDINSDDVTPSGGTVEIDLRDDPDSGEYTIRCYTVGVGGKSPPTKFRSFKSDNSDGTVETSGDETYDSGDSSKTLRSGGGKWKQVAAERILLSQPEFSPLNGISGNTKEDIRYFRLAFAIEGDSTTYYITVGDGSQIEYKPEPGSDSFNSKGVGIVEQESDGTTTQYQATLENGALDGWYTEAVGTDEQYAINILQPRNYDNIAGTTFETELGEIRTLLGNENKKPDVFVTNLQGRVSLNAPDTEAEIYYADSYHDDSGSGTYYNGSNPPQSTPIGTVSTFSAIKDGTDGSGGSITDDASRNPNLRVGIATSVPDDGSTYYLEVNYVYENIPDKEVEVRIVDDSGNTLQTESLPERGQSRTLREIELNDAATNYAKNNGEVYVVYYSGDDGSDTKIKLYHHLVRVVD